MRVNLWKRSSSSKSKISLFWWSEAKKSRRRFTAETQRATEREGKREIEREGMREVEMVRGKKADSASSDNDNPGSGRVAPNVDSIDRRSTTRSVYVCVRRRPLCYNLFADIVLLVVKMEAPTNSAADCRSTQKEVTCLHCFPMSVPSAPQGEGLTVALHFPSYNVQASPWRLLKA